MDNIYVWIQPSRVIDMTSMCSMLTCGPNMTADLMNLVATRDGNGSGSDRVDEKSDPKQNMFG
jgi:hypothetical protein